MKTIFILVLIVLSSGRNTSLAQESLRLWSATKKLSWGDFRGSPDSLSEYQALTCSQIEYLVTQEAVSYINFRIINSFVKTGSWSFDKTNKDLLSHENLHFDISELVTRLIRKKFSEYSLTEKEKSFNDLDSIFNYYAKYYRKQINHKYDVETSHGNIPEKQKEWEVKIAEELKALDKYASNTVVVKKKTAKSTSRKKKKWWKFW